MVWSSCIGLAIAGLAALCAANEAAFRWMKDRSLALPPATWAADPDLIYRLNPTNPDSPGSFRGKKAGRRRPGCTRIVCVGGSTTYGHGLVANDAWPAALERALGEKGVTADVINAGVPGYGSHQNLLRYRRDIASLEPDLVLIYEGWNRTGALVDPAGFVPYATPRPNASWGRRMSSLLARHSLLLQTWMTRAQWRRQKEPADRWSPDAYHGVFVSDVSTLVHEAQSRGQTPVLILYPALYYAGMSPADAKRFSALLWDVQSYRPEMLAELDRKLAALRQVALSTGALVIDAQQAFAAARGAERRALFLDDEHLSAAGCRRLAAALCERLAPLLAQRGAAAPVGSRYVCVSHRRPTPSHRT